MVSNPVDKQSYSKVAWAYVAAAVDAVEQEGRAAEDFTTGFDAYLCQTALPRSTSRQVHQRQV